MRLDKLHRPILVALFACSALPIARGVNGGHLALIGQSFGVCQLAATSMVFQDLALSHLLTVEKPGMDLQRHEKHQAIFDALFSHLKDHFSDREIQEVRSLSEANELGLALQTLIDIVMEERKTISREAVLVCVTLADLMGGRSEFEGLSEIESRFNN